MGVTHYTLSFSTTSSRPARHRLRAQHNHYVAATEVSLSRRCTTTRQRRYAAAFSLHNKCAIHVLFRSPSSSFHITTCQAIKQQAQISNRGLDGATFIQSLVLGIQGS
ncbi:predicted protein [Lichtheimia corymbifera JMRC:FSU:9682]|uniref:Uncharacterized protein n=1 Tax=Lichtheimia corymbifera JMRC:FSU:9682 TaxID=1263082 RepID=A0A068SAI4_9FUNG|nr:predicted protein [Lichtheimia corymbifera JMRC:FSU:9682]